MKLYENDPEHFSYNKIT